VFESINADVEWVPESKKVNVYKNDIVITLKINSNIAYINDNAVRLDVPARIVGGRTLVPVRFISESIGASVGWMMLQERLLSIHMTKMLRTKILKLRNLYLTEGKHVNWGIPK